MIVRKRSKANPSHNPVHYADNNTLYKCSPNLSVVLNCVDHGISIVLNWFQLNSLKANPQKFEFMALGGKRVSSISAILWTSLFFPEIK